MTQDGAGRPVALLTGGGDRPYALGLAASLSARGLAFDYIGSDENISDGLRGDPNVRALNLRGDMNPDAPLADKIVRVARYYGRLLRYAAGTDAKVFHLLWNNKIEYIDRTVVLAGYRLLGKRLAFTVHNVNIRERDGRDSWLNRLTLRCQYRLVDHLFVHTRRMADELQAGFGVAPDRISVIPFGINSTVPDTVLTPAQARARLGIDHGDEVALFYGNIAPYKGLDLLVEAMPALLAARPKLRLVVAGRPKGEADYWAGIERRLDELGIGARVTRRIEYVPDEETEVFFKAADVLVLPYRHVFQSGVLFLGYNFGVPAVAADVGSLKDEIVEGQTGLVCTPHDPAALAAALRRYFESDLYRDLAQRRQAIRRYAAERYSWATVAAITCGVYERLCGTTLTDGTAAATPQAKSKLG